MYYSVWDQNQVVGRASLKAEGMYYLVQCICDRKNDQKRSVFLTSHGTKIRIGLLAPEGNAMAVQKRLRKKQIDLSDIRFYADVDEIGFRIEEDQPFSQLSRIKNMRLSTDGTVTLQQQAANTRDNDQSP